MWEGLRIDPCPPKELGKVEAVRTYRGVKVRVVFDATEYDPMTPPTLTVNGVRQAGCVLAPSVLAQAKQPVEVRVSWQHQGQGTVSTRGGQQSATGKQGN